MRRVAVVLCVLASTLAAGVAPAWAADSTPVTLPASNITSHSATLNGSVLPPGPGSSISLTDCHFEYGPTTSYGQSAACATPPSGMAPASVSADVSTLAPGTTYHFQLFITSTDSSAVTGGDLVFQTPPATSPPAAPTATTGSASSVTFTKAILNGTVDIKDGTPISCMFDYGQTAVYTNSVNCSTVPSGSGSTAVSAAVTGLTAGTGYHFQVVIITSGGGAQGGDQTFTTATAPTVATTAATGIFSTAATANGTVNPEGSAITDCHFIYGTNPGSLSSTAPCSSTPSGSSDVPVSAALTGLSANTTYFYELVAVGKVGDETDSVTTTSPTTFMTNSTPPPPPQAVTYLAGPITTTSATVYGFVNGEGVGITDCHFAYGTTTSYGSTVPCSPSGLATSTKYQLVSGALSSLQPNTTYHYEVIVTTAGGQATGGDKTFTTSPPDATTGAASSVTQTSATLNATVNPNGNPVLDCHFDWGTTTAYGSTAKCASTPSGSTASAVRAALSGLTAGTSYHFRIVVSTTAGITRGVDATFTTLKAYVIKPTLKRPNTVITKSSINRRKHTAGFRFKATVAHATSFQCSLVKLRKGQKPHPRYGTCRSPKSYKHLKKGSYEFFVRAHNAAGFDPTPATKKFKI